MRIFLTGATGFIGGHVLRELSRRGHEVTCLVRPGRTLPHLPGVTAVQGHWTHIKTWEQHLQHQDVAVNAVGTLRHHWFCRFRTVHTKAAIAFFEAAREAGVKKIVQLSALGAVDGASRAFFRSKRAADSHLEQMRVAWVILRPSLVYGQGDHHSTLWKRLAAFPLTPVPGNGRYTLQPVHVFDVAQALAIATENPALRRIAVDMGGGQILSFNEIMDALAYRQAKPNGARKVHIPMLFVWLAALFTDLLAGNGPITTQELQILRRGAHADNTRFISRFGFSPRPFI